MTDVIGLGGPPASGKSTIIKTLLREHDLTDPTPFEYGALKGTLYRDTELILFGIYDDGDFTGTDRLAMNVAPDAEQFITDAVDSPTYTHHTILFEGDRLYTGSFLTHIRDTLPTPGTNAWFPLLTVPDTELDQRHADRADDQSETWLQGRHTKYENLAESDLPTPTVPHETPADTDRIVATLRDCLETSVADAQPTSALDAGA